MKKAIVITMALLISNILISRAQTFNYSHDGCGNRTYRTYTEPSLKVMELQLVNDSITEDMELVKSLEENTPPDQEEIEALETGTILIFPNPNEGIFTIALPLKDNAVAQIAVFDYAGRQVYRAITDNPQNQIDITQWPNGTYIVKINIAGETVLHKMVKK